MINMEQGTKNPMRQLQGARSRADGKYFESVIDVSCAWYRDRQMAHIEKTPEPMKVLRPVPNTKRRFVACFEHKAQPDYKGTLRNGMAVVFEAKHTDGDRIERSRLTQEQMEGLEIHYRLGAVAFVLVSFGFQEFYRVPWQAWRDMKKRFGRQYIRAGEMAEWKVGNEGGVLRFLAGIV